MLRLDPGEEDEETMGGAAVKEEEEDGEDSDEEGEDDFLVADAAAGDGQRPPERRRGRGREEKERTKARERRRRAVTGRILAGLRRHGGFGLRSRADVNEVVAALARHAGWVVLPDGTTFPCSHPNPQVYFDFMRSFRVEFDEYFEDGIISEIEVGLGACGELRYPSYAANHGWKYPGIGEFQCYDRYLQKNLRRAAEARGHAMWAKSPDNAGHYNSEPNNTGFFCDGGDYDSYYGRFFLNWYAQVLLDHADRVLMLARLAFEGSAIAVKVSGIHWWYKTASHAAELTAGFYNPCNRDGYAPIAQVLKKHGAALNFTCVELRTMDQHEVFPEALADPEGLVWQVLNAAWDAGIQVASENALPCYDRDGFNKTLENAKPRNDPDGRHLFGFTYLRLCNTLFEGPNLPEFERFVKRMHGEAVLDLKA